MGTENEDTIQAFIKTTFDTRYFKLFILLKKDIPKII